MNKQIIVKLSLGLILIAIACSPMRHEKSIQQVINESLDLAVTQSLQIAETLDSIPGVLPKTINKDGALVTCSPSWWVSGFFPGQLWYLYEFSGDTNLLKYARIFSHRVEGEQYTTDNHDVGFMIFCPFGNGYRITNDSSYLKVIKQAAYSLSTRYNPAVGCIRSWDYAEWNKQWQYPVIIDNMMNLELLLWAADKFNISYYKEIAISHANKTIANHYRSDYSCYHVVSYDTLTGKPQAKETAQGYNNESAWARGQAWGLYGFTMMYRYTGDTVYLHQAENIADFIINHPNFPEDGIPYWDFNAPDIPNTYRDASAAAIICSALIELSSSAEKHLAKKYLGVAELQIRTLSSSACRNKLGENVNFILKHSVGHMPNHSEVDVPLTYADYYYVEALMRYKKLKIF